MTAHATPSAPWRHAAFAQGARDMAGPALGLAAWGVVTGVAMIKSGLSLPLALLMSLTVFAGSAQLAALPLLAAQAPLWVVLATCCCVNMRFVVFSSQWRNYLGHLPRRQRLWTAYFSIDMNFVLFLQRFPDASQEVDAQLPYYWGGAAVCWTSWQLASILGMLLAAQVPTQWGLGYAGVLALLGLALVQLKDRATWMAAAAAAVVSVWAYALPLRLNILLAIVAAVALGVYFDQRQRARGR
ncbi:AzlC family ABC transporter permease [Roseateles sp. BYS180W]|uniref:AzlC family ABC transporter permease n=1 Tax=Roseateles rivi TaxID=3299028 RepID=A0ABW7FWK8_9BURK